MKRWEVCLFSDVPHYQVKCRDFRTLWGARRFVRKTLRRDSGFYCATIWNEDETESYTFYWNGEKIISWDKPWVLSSRQALSLKDEY